MADSTTPSVPFSMHRRAAYGAVVVALGMASLAELVAVHLLVVRWSPAGAWALTALSVYGLAWLLADYHAVRRRKGLAIRRRRPHDVAPGGALGGHGVRGSGIY